MKGCRSSSALDFFLLLTFGWDVGDYSRMHSALRLRLKALAACWDFQFTQWFSPINPCAVFPSFLRAKIENVSQTERTKCLSMIESLAAHWPCAVNRM